MNASPFATGDQLANAQHTLSVRFIMSEAGEDDSLHREPERLITALVQCDEGRNAYHEANDDWASAEYRMDVAAVLAKRCTVSI